MKKFYWVIVTFSVLTMAGYWFLYRDLPMMAPDSMGYVGFSPSRTPGYPLFLWLCNAVFGSYDLVPVIQLTLLFASIAYLTVQFYTFSGSWLWSLGLWFLLAGNLEIIKYAFLLLTESLTISVLLFSLGVLCQFISTRLMRYLLILSALSGIAILIRPASYGWVLALLLAGIGLKAFMPKISYKSIVGTLAYPLAGALILGSAFNYCQHGFFNTQSFLGEMLIGKIGALADKDIPTKESHVMTTLSNYSAPVQTLLKAAPSWRIEYLISAVYADQYRYSHFAQQLKKEMLNGSTLPQALDKKRILLAIEVMLARPFAYLHNVLINYIALWQVWDLATPREAQQMADFLKQEAPLPGNVEYPDYPRQAAYKKGSWLAIPLRVALLWVFCVTVWAPLTLLTRVLRQKPISEALYLITVSAGFVQGAYLATALVQSGIPRFFLIMWPAVVLIGVSSVWCVLKNKSISDKK